MMNMREFMEMQLKLQIGMKEANPTQGGDPFEMTPEELASFMTWNHTALIVELSEALAEVGWKPWASSRHINYEAFVKEMVDAWHFFLNMMLAAAALSQHPVYDIAGAFDQGYMEKNAKNLQRQIDGYDGVGGKCTFCGRDLTEIEPHIAHQPDGSVVTYCMCGHVLSTKENNNAQ